MGATTRAALIGLGSNLGDRLAYLQQAARALATWPQVGWRGGSSIYESPPLGPVEQGPFLNAAALIETALAPAELLAVLLAIEQRLGRVRLQRWGPRTIDLDLLWLDGVTVAEPDLQVPHPGLAERAFVLLPVAELRPGLRLSDGRTARQAAEEMADDACLRVPGATLDG
ncbi:MAG: 2-amino-4-hydroxy-6-hydroxymethyldihydropteridine diphosphokinase [Fimbriimonadaceae bacterium]|nr:2-amino-4-hydroxy-6-hydroxymethyldihydropteridine diphosphokinase [Fimbriimonadaceae bacterium]